MKAMNLLFMRNITNISISSSLNHVLPSVKTRFAHELMRSQKLEAINDPMHPSENMASSAPNPIRDADTAVCRAAAAAVCRAADAVCLHNHPAGRGGVRLWEARRKFVLKMG
jgi:hypothetical protein